MSQVEETPEAKVKELKAEIDDLKWVIGEQTAVAAKLRRQLENLVQEANEEIKRLVDEISRLTALLTTHGVDAQSGEKFNPLNEPDGGSSLRAVD